MRFTALVLVLVAGCAVEDANPNYPNPGPTGPQPTNTPILAAAGGTACIGQSTLCVFFPAGSLSEDVTVTIRQASGLPTPGAILASSAFNILFVPDTVTFTGTATLTYQLPSVSLTGRNLGVAYATVMGEWAFDGVSSLSHTPGATLDVVSADTTHFTPFAVVDMDVLVGCVCDVDATCSGGCACDPDCVCACDVDATCSNGCACDPDCIVTDEPDIAVAWTGYDGPNPALDCASGVCTVPVGNAIDFGSLAPFGSATAQLTIANRAACSGACDACAIDVAPNVLYWNLGLGFGLNEGDAFSFVGSVTTPFEIRQESVSCSESGEVTVLVQFTAPPTPGDYSGVIVVESNDPDEAVIEIPIIGTTAAGTPPVAMAGVRTCPDDPCTDPSTILPMDRIYLDGTMSYDTDGTVQSYSWRVDTYPGGVTPGDLNPSGVDSEYFEFTAPAEGVYEAQLTVTDNDGLQSADTTDGRVTLVVVDTLADIRVSLTWDTDADLDLHFTIADTQPDLLCNAFYDCYYNNTTPLWFTASPAGQGPNPHMDADSGGYGPENTVIDVADGANHYYNVYVHYYDSTGAPTGADLTVTVDGQGTTFQRQLQPNDVWAAATIVWTGIVNLAQEYPTDGGGQGAVSTLAPGACTDWDFPL